MVNTKTKVLYVLIASGLVALLFSVYSSLNTASQDSIGAETYEGIIISHPRVFITKYNKNALQEKAQGVHSDTFALLTRRMKHEKIPRGIKELKDYIYKYGYLYQITGDKKWANYAIAAMEAFPKSIKAYGGANAGYSLAIEGLSIGFDWCYDAIVELNKKQYFVDLINTYYQGNKDNIARPGSRLPDFHNYAAPAEFAMLIAGLATYGDNPKAIDYIKEARNIMENGLTLDGAKYCVKDSVRYVDGTCNWEGVTYGRHPLFAYIKYCEAWKTATNGKINPWENSFSLLENAGYYIIYSLRPDNIFENIGDVNYSTLSYFDINNLAGLQGHFKNAYFTSFLKTHTHWKTGKKDKGIWSGRYNAPIIFYLLWHDPTVPESNLKDLPIARRFGDTIIIRTGFGPDDTFVSFKSGIHWGFHSQLDHGSFTIFKNAPLAIDSGYYDNWNWGKKHNWNYWKRTIAHNTLLIDNPDEKPVYWPKKFALENDGGQRLAWVSFRPPHLFSGSHNKPLSISDLKNRFEEFSMGKITCYEPKDNYVYIRTDLTDAYNNKYCGSGNNQPCKAKLVERQFAYLRPDFVVVFDRVDALKSSFTKKWLLHSGSYWDKSGKPELNGSSKTVMGTEEAGIAESTNTDLVTIKNGDGKLFVKTLLPMQHITRTVGGEGYEFWVGGKNRAIAPHKRYRENEDPGAWRIEIQPMREEKYDEFLNALYPCNRNTTFPPLISKIETVSKNMVGVQIKDGGKSWVVLFNRSTSGAFHKAEYTIDAASNCQHLLFGCKPNTYYEVRLSSLHGKCKVVLGESKGSSGFRSSAQGVLLFKTQF